MITRPAGDFADVVGDRGDILQQVHEALVGMLAGQETTQPDHHRVAHTIGNRIGHHRLQLQGRQLAISPAEQLPTCQPRYGRGRCQAIELCRGSSLPPATPLASRGVFQ